MTTAYRQLIEITLQIMEPGIFQDFCLDFLPLYDNRFIGLERFGHTAAGKTRAGTPDLIKTDSSGGQIAVQCSTAADYWEAESTQGSKPHTDAVKCIEQLANLCEIVLLSNREIPTGTPNIKADIILSLREKTEATITLISIAEIGQFLSASLQEPKTKMMVHKYFPEVAIALGAEEESQRYRLALSVVRDHEVDARTLLELAAEALTAFPQPEEARQYVVEHLDSLNRCRLSAAPIFKGVTRGSVDTLPLHLPLGDVFVLGGVPKIGKTSLLLQLARSWTEYTVKWFDIPIEGSEGCSEEISRDLIKALLPDEDVGQLLRSPVLLASKLECAGLSSTPMVLIVDNANHLPDVGLRHLFEVFAVLKRHGLLENIGCIFATNRRLSGLSTIAKFVGAPEWTPSELGQLLEMHGLGPSYEGADQYLELLKVLSGGHPLVSIALARRHKTIADLLANQLTAKPALDDEMLSHEVQILLYEGILTDADSQNLVHRLSVLIDRVPPDVLEVLRRSVDPPIATPVAVLLDRLHGSVVEGDQENGYSVPLVFRQVAKQKITQGEIQAVHRAVSEHLLTSDGRVFQAERVVSGIIYAMLALQQEKALFWTSLLLKNVLSKPIADEQLSALISMLVVVPFVNPPHGLRGQLIHTFTLLMFAVAYSRLGQDAEAANVLGRTELYMPAASGPDDLRKALYLLRFGVRCYRAICMVSANTGNPLDTLSAIEPVEIVEASEEQLSVFFDIAYIVISRSPPTEGSQGFIQDVLKRMEGGSDKEREYGLNLAINIGGRAREAGRDLDFVNGFFPNTPFGDLLRHSARGVLLTEAGETGHGILELDKAMMIAPDLEINSGNFWARLQLSKADAAYKGGTDDVAEAAYAASVEAASPRSFEHGWSSWRIGLLLQDEQALAQAAEAFREMELYEFWARAVGARGALLIKSDMRSEGLRCFAELVERYYIGKEDVIGPGVAVAQSHVMRLKAELECRPISETDERFPAFTAGVYEIVLPTARPRAGPIVSFFVLAETYELLGEKDNARHWINRGLDLLPEDELDKRTYPIVIKACLKSLSYSIEDRPQIRKCVDRLLEYQSVNVETPREMLSHCVFAQADELLQHKQEAARSSLLLDVVEEAIAKNGVNKTFWEAEIFVRRAAVARAIGSDAAQIARLYKHALQKANESGNGSVMVVSGHELGFELIDLTGSLRETAHYQFAVIEGIALQGSSYEQLDKVGGNLYTVWTAYTWRRLSEYDLQAKKFLMDSAVELKAAGVPKDEAERVMVLLLANLFQCSSPAVDWVRERLGLPIDALPPSVRNLLIDR